MTYLFDIVYWIIELFFNIFYQIFGFATGLVIDARLLEVLIGFEGVILALAVPLSHQVIANISERYNSEAVTGLFTRKFAVKWLPRLLFLSIPFTVLLTLTCGQYDKNPIWRLLVLVSVVMFLLVISLLIKYLKILAHYSSKSEVALEEHLKNAEKFLD